MTTNNTNPAKAKKSTSETGHNINAANFGKAYQILTEMGTLYNPSNPSLLLTALEPKKNGYQSLYRRA